MIAQRVVTQPTNGTVNPTMLTVTPEIAARWLETMLYEHQRPIRQSHVEFLAEEMRRGRFIQGLQIHVVEFGDTHVIVDGYHRLWAIIESGSPQRVAVLHTKVSRKEEIAWIYGNTDIGMRRTGAHLLGALELSGELQCTSTEIRQLSGAIPFMQSGCVRSAHTQTKYHKDELVRDMRLYAPYARMHFALLDKAGDTIAKRANRSSSLAIALLTWRYAHPFAESRGDPSIAEFWRGAFFDDGVPIGDPRKLVYRHLIGVLVTASGARGTGNGDVVTTGYAARYIVACFNAYMERRTLIKTVVRDAAAPLRMYGTPSDHTQWFI